MPTYAPRDVGREPGYVYDQRPCKVVRGSLPGKCRDRRRGVLGDAEADDVRADVQGKS
jgi:hypothetical protein